ncbi:hypothetical protein OV203_10935 [Nannocystis sp. ILAH1]|uniref:hypothetical protein n=1 Tax=Nannocystis sp. ILAH1 TaxID=2996789 RepID=UPI00226E8EB5|nr:hypothetical protein [Nannocystis sp. ILAH1]MCY0987642.1 hypothetical protein [Nannocystis sp. ILAH1]
MRRKDLWIARHAPDATRMWTFEQVFGPANEAEGWRVAAAPNGDVVVVATFRLGDGYANWLGRLAGG